MANLFSFTLQGASSEEHQESGVGEPGKRYGMTAGGQVREEELMASLQMLLEKVEKGQFAMGPGESKIRLAAMSSFVEICFEVKEI